jgi:hypothetical protein
MKMTTNAAKSMACRTSMTGHPQAGVPSFTRYAEYALPMANPAASSPAKTSSHRATGLRGWAANTIMPVSR